ncbi:flagellar filament capping protein FliD [Sphingomonas sp. HHU CXW]|uniref:Flagellar hook-associated protein 2 n=1 Tax=Sphingomonas hominis TaxID=2741495 RepID=A0ABX2JFW6_9SPHN|nr:flagellar filament capping protein FliD [Sphingomonas hominis]NTS65212.1 flagellar filament capping protein FliD [Sphingomonas hominis]
MTTTSATSGTTPTPTPTKSTASVTTSATNSLLTSLGTGSGVDTSSLVTSLVDAQFAAKKSALSTKLDTISSQISAVATLKSNITDFTKALENLVKGGTLASQPVVSNAGVLSATALTGAKLSGLNSTIKVTQLATAQTAVSAKEPTPKTTTFGEGTLTLKIGTIETDIDGKLVLKGSDADGDKLDDTIAIKIDETNNTLSGIAAAINAKKTGVTASIVTDADGGAYLSLKGVTGAAQAFSLSADSASLAPFAVNPLSSASAMAVSSQSQNAQLTMDGVEVERASNEVSDLIAGAKLNLTAAGTTTLTSSRPTTAITNAVNDFVDTYNGIVATIKEQTDPITGVLRADPAAKNLLRALQGLTSKVLNGNAGAGVPNTLAAIGIRTTRQGMLEVDSNALTAAMTTNADAVEAMFSYGTSDGIYSAMQSLQLNATSSIYGLGASNSNYLKTRSDTTEKQDKLTDQAASMTARLTQQFSSMNSKVSAYKSTQSFMQQQIDQWSKSN